MMNVMRTGQIKGKSIGLAGLHPLYSVMLPCILLLIPKPTWAHLALLGDLVPWKICLLYITIKIICDADIPDADFFHHLYSYILLLIISRVLQLGLYLFLYRSRSLFLSMYFPQVWRGISICWWLLKHKIWPNYFKLRLFL